jgi:hypothetical protein
MNVPSQSEQRLAAVLSDAAEPMDPVVSPGRALTQRAQRRAAARRSGVVAGALAAVLAVGGAGVWLSSQVQDSGPVTPAGDPPQSVRDAADRGPDGVGDGAVGEDSGQADGGDLVDGAAPVQGVDYELVQLLGNSDGHTYLTAGDYAYALEWLWTPQSMWVTPFVLPEVSPADVEVVAPRAWPEAVADCLTDAGYQARVEVDLPWVDPADRDIDMAWHARRCALTNQPEWAYADLTEQEWHQVYDYLETSWSECEAQTGSPVYWLVQREEFVDLALQGPLPERISNLDERRAGATCSRFPPHLRLGTTD